MIIGESLLTHIYSVYGLKIKSEILLPELCAISEMYGEYVDATINYGMVSKELDDVLYKDEYIQVSRTKFYLYIKGVAHYYVADGNSILIEPEDQCNEEQIKLYLLGTSLGMMLIQRNTVAIHGGTVVIDGQGIIITGQSGAGKSTLTSAFRKAGYSFLADDVSALGSSLDGELIVNPTYPQQKLCKDAMEKMGYKISDFVKIDLLRDKYAVPLNENFLSFPVPLSYIYEINVGTSSKVEIREVLGSEKVKRFLRNIYRIEISLEIGIDPNYFKRCLDIINKVKIYEITRPMDAFTVEEQMKLIKTTLIVMDEKVV